MSFFLLTHFYPLSYFLNPPMNNSDCVFLVTHSHFCDGSPEEVAEDMKKQLDANPNTIQVSSAVYGVLLLLLLLYQLYLIRLFLSNFMTPSLPFF
jgi:hypothetical protein